MDRITNKYVTDFLASNEIESRGIEKDFEFYVNYCLISDYTDQTFDVENITVGSGNDTGIDGISIIINGQVVEDKAQVEALIEQKEKIEVLFIFVQAKSGQRFEQAEINVFGTGVTDFFSENPKKPRNEDIQRYSEITELIFDNPRLLKTAPQCKLFYVVAGKPNKSDLNHQAIITIHRESLEETNLFKEVSFEKLGASEINELFRRSINPSISEFTFVNRIILPGDLPGIKEAHFGTLPLSEFKKILLDDNGRMKAIFEDNVRDFQGEKNTVNKKISETLQGELPQLFVVLNNGINIVASDVKTIGQTFILEDYQIVNGCQTSNMIFESLDSLSDREIQIPVKIIITNDENIKNQITVATNSQTSVKREQLQAMTKFQKDLEEFYIASTEEKLFYERRSGQYRSNNRISRARIITLQNQIKSFSAMYLENPHHVTSYFGGLIKKQIESELPTIFAESHPFELYYCAGLAYYRLESLFRLSIIHRKYKKVRFFILMLFRRIIQPERIELKNIQNPKNAQAYAKKILDTLADEKKSELAFKKAIGLWDRAGIDLEDKEILKLGSTTDKLLLILSKVEL
ncbi:MAG: AIPR family protein [Anaerolineaceae bacterium]|nr:AIPR family protein [Anaerolineaceae bacterium]